MTLTCDTIQERLYCFKNFVLVTHDFCNHEIIKETPNFKLRFIFVSPINADLNKTKSVDYSNAQAVGKMGIALFLFSCNQWK